MTLPQRISAHFRAQRMRQFLEVCKPTPETLLLDVGGNPSIWKLVPASRRPRVVFLNLPRAFEPGDDEGTLVFGDGLRLPFADQSFDLVFSNSVIEHVGSEANQQAFAKEIQRVGKRYWVQTPNRGFPVEQHLLTPFVHWLPLRLKARAARTFTVWDLVARPDAASRRFYIEHFLQDIRLLDRRQLAALFPGAKIVAERVGPATKSWIAYRT